jgi:hypothetical protein
LITTGSKYFLGLSVAAFIGFLLYGIGNNWGAMGVIGIGSVVAAAGFLLSITSYTRDAHASSLDTEALTTSAAALAPARRSLWPLFGAVGVTLLAVGLVTYQPIFMAGIVVILYTIVAWAITAWSEHASGSDTFNAEARARLLNPLEFPLLGALGAGVVAFSLSRIMLGIDPKAGAVVFGGAAAAVLLVGWVFSVKVSGKAIAALGAAGLALVVGSGVAFGVSGEREQLAEASEEDHFDAHHRECESPDEQAFDEDAARAVPAKSSVAATVTLQDGRLTAQVSSIESDASVLTLSRGNVANILFRNEDDEDRRLTIALGTEQIEETEAVAPVLQCTALIGEGQEQLLTVRPTKPSAAFPDAPFELFVPGVEGATIEVEVP